MIVDEDSDIYSYPSMKTEIECKFDANPAGMTTLSTDGKDQTFEGNTAVLQINAEEADFPSTYACYNKNSVGEKKYTIELKKASIPKELRNVKTTRVGIVDVDLEWSRDYSVGQIDLVELIVTLEARQRPVRVLRYPLMSQSRVTLTDLEPETQYKVAIQGQNIVGQSPVSRSITFTTKKLGMHPIDQVFF